MAVKELEERIRGGFCPADLPERHARARTEMVQEGPLLLRAQRRQGLEWVRGNNLASPPNPVRPVVSESWPGGKEAAKLFPERRSGRRSSNRWEVIDQRGSRLLDGQARVFTLSRVSRRSVVR